MVRLEELRPVDMGAAVEEQIGMTCWALWRICAPPASQTTSAAAMSGLPPSATRFL